jgi:hypothetical protein
MIFLGIKPILCCVVSNLNLEIEMVTKIDDGDYELTDGCAWLSTKGFAIRIHTTDESVFVDIYKEVGTDQLYDAPLASYMLLHNEVDVDVPEPADDIFGN